MSQEGLGPFTPPNPSGGKPQPPGITDGLLNANHELRASIVSNVITKGLVGLGVGVGLALFVFRRTIIILPF